MENESKITPSLEVRLFGTFHVRVKGEPMPPLRSRQGQALFGLLILRQTAETERDWLASALWPDSTEAQALYNLRRNLTDLRRALGSEAVRLLAPAPRRLRFDLTGVEVDALAFDAALAAGGEENRERAVALYGGELLPGCDVQALNQARQQREQAYLGALEQLAGSAAETDSATALRWLRRLLSADALRETALRDMMRLLARRGECAAITEVYRDFRLYLRRELNSDPAPETVALYRELSLPDRSAVFPAAPSPAPRRLPTALTRLIGREAEVQAACQLLRATRLLTLTGAGGIGKTRLALAAAEASAAGFPGGVWFADLSPLTEGVSVLSALAAVLEIGPLTPGQTPADALQAFLATRRALLVLDNCEHLVDACADAAHFLLTRCPHLKMIATSRQPLGLMGETIRQVPPLDLPPLPGRDAPSGDAGPFQKAIGDYAAVRLFADRAKRVCPGWSLSPVNAETAARVCRQLDGLPLALELAAARMQTLSLDEMEARLNDRFRLLSVGNRGTWPRHQNLTALLDWSYDLLNRNERELLRRLSVFAGGWSLEAVEQVCSGETPDGLQIEPQDALYLLLSLAEKSLILCETQEEAETRYRMLETVRQYARQRLEAEPNAVALLAQRHADYYLQQASSIKSSGEPEAQTASLACMEREKDNYGAALSWLLTDETRPEKALQMACDMSEFWSQRGLSGQGYARMITALERAGEQASPLLRASALDRAGGLAHQTGDYTHAVTHFEAALALHRTRKDRRSEGCILGSLGDVFSNRGEYGRARSLLEQALIIARETADADSETLALSRMGYLAREQGDYAESRRLTEQALAVRRRIGDRLGEAWNLGSLGYAIGGEGNWKQAAAYFEQGLTIYRECGQRSGEAWSLTSLGHAARQEGDFSASRSLLEQALAIQRELGVRASEAWNLDELSATLYTLGDYDAARRSAYDALRINREIGGRRLEAVNLFRLGHIFRAEHDPAMAWRFYVESARILLEMELNSDLLDVAEGLAALAAKSKHIELFARIDGAISAFKQSQNPLKTPMGSPPAENDWLRIQPIASRKAFLLAWREGERLTLAQAIAPALDSDAGPC